MLALNIEDVTAHYEALKTQVPLEPLRTEKAYRKAVSAGSITAS